MISRCPRNSKTGFTLVELLVVITILAIIAGMIPCTLANVKERAWRVDCLSNMNQIWKSMASWGLDPTYQDRPNFPTSNIVGPDGVLTPIGGISPICFVCPTAAKDYGTKPASNLCQMTASHSSYCYFNGRTDRDGEKVILCDQDGPMRVATTNQWGSNHRLKGNVFTRRVPAQGGNIIKVSGAGMWVSTTNDPGLSAVCITNPAIAAAFETNTNTVVYFY